MATRPPDEAPPPPDSPPPEEPVRTPDEIVPGPDEIVPGHGDTDQPDATPIESPGAPSVMPPPD